MRAYFFQSQGRQTIEIYLLHTWFCFRKNWRAKFVLIVCILLKLFTAKSPKQSGFCLLKVAYNLHIDSYEANVSTKKLLWCNTSLYRLGIAKFKRRKSKLDMDIQSLGQHLLMSKICAATEPAELKSTFCISGDPLTPQIIETNGLNLNGQRQMIYHFDPWITQISNMLISKSSNDLLARAAKN